MSLIACTSNCVYQQDGYCGLQRAASTGMPCEQDPCVNFVPRRQEPSLQRLERLPDVPDTDQL